MFNFLKDRSGMLLIIYIINIIITMEGYIPEHVKNSIYANTIKDFSLKVIKDFVYCFINV